MTTQLSKRLSEAKLELDLSTRQIKDAAARGGHDISIYTVSQCLNGKHGNVTRKTIEALAFALQVSEQELTRLAGLPEQHGHLSFDGKVAENAGALTRVQADAVAEIIRQLAEANRKAGGERADSSTSITEAGEDTPAHDVEDELAARRKEPHRRRRPGHDPEWDELYSDKRAAAEGDPAMDKGEISDDST